VASVGFILRFGGLNWGLIRVFIPLFSIQENSGCIHFLGRNLKQTMICLLDISAFLKDPCLFNFLVEANTIFHGNNGVITSMGQPSGRGFGVDV